ncbi:MAG: molybdopterin cofactor-binding domain-containing protein, partial [Chloroflexota bacterium]
MSPAPVSRREFLKITVGAGAGLVLGSYLSGCRSLNSTPFVEIKPGAFSPNVFVGIDPDNTVTIVVPRTEMGQGVRTALPMIVAEELDVDWASVRVETAPAGDEYGNQETGGSTSVSTFWWPLRQAGATARAMLVAAAAQQWGAAPEDCTTEKGRVIHPETARQLSYGELAAAAAQLPVPDTETISLKDPKNFRLVGQSIKRVDDPHIVDGGAIFGMDVKRPEMLYATIARSPVFWGKPAGFDAAAAKAVEGVKDVVEIDNAVAVVAENTWAAIKGREALQVTWDEGDMAGVSSDGIREQVLAQLPDGVAIGNAAAQAAGKLSVLYEIPNFAHASMEPMNCVAEARADRCEVWAPTQNPQQARSEILAPADAGRLDRLLRPFTGWSKEAVKVNVPLIGGGFGRRLNVDYVTEAVQVSKAIGRPVQVVWTREDDIQHDWYHPLSYHHVSANLEPLAEMEQKTFESPVPIPWGAWR